MLPASQRAQLAHLVRDTRLARRLLVHINRQRLTEAALCLTPRTRHRRTNHCWQTLRMSQHANHSFALLGNFPPVPAARPVQVRRRHSRGENEADGGCSTVRQRLLPSTAAQVRAPESAKRRASPTLDSNVPALQRKTAEPQDVYEPLRQLTTDRHQCHRSRDATFLRWHLPEYLRALTCCSHCTQARGSAAPPQALDSGLLEDDDQASIPFDVRKEGISPAAQK